MSRMPPSLLTQSLFLASDLNARLPQPTLRVSVTVCCDLAESRVLGSDVLEPMAARDRRTSAAQHL